MMEWFEEENFWSTLFPFMFPERRFTVADEEIDKVIALVNFQGNKVLDLCCGPGRHSCSLAKKGYKVTGVDRTSFLLNKAKKRGCSLKLEIEWVLKDMRDFVRPSAFDLILNLFTSFGYFDNKEDDIKVLKNIYKSLRLGGICIIDSLGKEIIAKGFKDTTSNQLEDGSILIERHEIFDDWSRIRNEWILINGDKAQTFKFHHTLYSGQELKDKLYGVGFSDVKLFGNLDGIEYGINASRLIAVARK